ncbi:peptidase S8/S53 domain-containing protein [Paraphysoderma sedebokerense]|nr:peptidase S8/S53 domain-containing protein [Paraphysoderma sedebokerense]
MKGIKSIDGEIPRITKIMMFDPTERLPEGFHTYIALLTNTIIEKISAVSGIHILKDFNIKLSLGSLDPTVSNQPNFSPLVHAISKRSPILSDDFDPNQAYVGLARQKVATESRLGNWGLDRIDQPSFKRDGWYHYHPSGGEGVRVVVMDSGITPHRDFEDRLLPSRSFIQDNNIQDDSNTSGHGTFVASFIGSSKTGVAKKANLQSFTIVDGFEAKYSRILIAMYVLSDDVVTSRKRKKEKIVVNMSFGFPKATATAFDLKKGMYEIESLAVRMVEVGAILVKSAGNSGADECDMVLNRVPEIINVGAINMDDQRWEFSNYGDCVDIYAPGHRVLGFDPDLNVYHHGSGTSFAAPHVAGVIALYLSSEFFDEVPMGKLAAIVKEQLIKNAWILPTRIDSFQGTFPRVVNAIPKFLYQRL